MQDRQHNYASRFDSIEDSVGKLEKAYSSDVPVHDRSAVRILLNLPEPDVKLVNELKIQPGTPVRIPVGNRGDLSDSLGADVDLQR